MCGTAGFPGGGVSFGVRVTSKGRKSFVTLYRKNGRLTRKTLGTYPELSLADARQKARDDVGKIVRGEDPKAKRPEDRTFGELAEHFMEKHPKRAQLKERTIAEYRRIFDSELLPLWKDRLLSTITRTDVNDLLDEIAYARGVPVMANRVLALVSVAFNYAIDEGSSAWGIEVNPCYRLKKRIKEEPRQRVLTDYEIRSLWKELDENRAERTGAVYKLILLTGQRGGEVTAMRWDDIDGNVWTIPATLSKNNREHQVPLSSQALQILDSLHKKEAWNEWVFPSRAGGHVRSFGNNNKRIQDKLGFEFRPHDLRRTCATRLAELKICDDSIIGRVLNHSWVLKNVTNSVYNMDDRLPEKRAALERWGSRLEQILTEQTAKIVRMR